MAARRLIEHHAAEEEQALFPGAARAISKEQLAAEMDEPKKGLKKY